MLFPIVHRQQGALWPPKARHQGQHKRRRYQHTNVTENSIHREDPGIDY